MPTTITVAFDITRWVEVPYDEPVDGPKLARATVEKRFSGILEGTSRAELLLCQGGDGAGYLGSERVTGVLDGREGTFVIQHGGIVDGETPRAFGSIVPGSGTGDLEGIRGSAAFSHDATGAHLTLTYILSRVTSTVGATA